MDSKENPLTNAVYDAAVDTKTQHERNVMKKLLSVAIATIALTMSFVTAGCKTVPTADTVYGCSKAIGVSAGIVFNELKLTDKQHNKAVEIVTKVYAVTPEVGQTFTEAWSDIAARHVRELVENGEISELDGKFIYEAAVFAMNGMDYLMAKYPVVKTDKDLLFAAVNGFGDGFLAIAKPVNYNDEQNAAKGLSADANALDYMRVRKPMLVK